MPRTCGSDTKGGGMKPCIKSFGPDKKPIVWMPLPPEKESNMTSEETRLREQLDDALRVQERLAANVNQGLLELRQVQAQLAEAHANLEAQRFATYQAVERELEAKRALTELMTPWKRRREGVP